jgi:spermidine synthase
VRRADRPAKDASPPGRRRTVLSPASHPEGAECAEELRRRGRRITRLLPPIFFVSGLSSLIYQVVWQRLLTLHYGVGSISITLIVSVYMLGLGLGALVGGWLSERLRSGLLAYCAIEILIGIFGVASLPYLELVGRATAGSDYFLSFLAMFSFLLLPTLLMGATLPVLVKAFNRIARNFLRSVSLLYFINTLGAAIGALVTAYGLISFWGLDVAIYWAVSLNLLLAAAVFGLARGGDAAPAPLPALQVESHREPASEPGIGLWVYPLVFVSGFLAIGYELAWFRLIGVLIKASPYAFATTLSVYLFGIAFGSYGVERFLRWSPEISRVRLFFVLQFLTGIAVLVLVVVFSHASDIRPLADLAQTAFRGELHPSSWQIGDLLGVFLWPVFFELVPTLLIGATFPLLASAALRRPDREGVTVGRVYFVNTVGNLLGGILCGLVLLEVLGTEWTLLCFASTNLLLFLLAPRKHDRLLVPPRRLAVVASCLLFGLVAAPGAGDLYRTMHRGPGPDFELFFEEGADGVVATFEKGPRVVNYINGLLHGGRPDASFVVETLEALAAAHSVDDILIIGFGTGTITEVALSSPDVERVTLVELSRTLMKNLDKMQVFRRILADPRLEVIYDDGRRYLLRSDADYDLILMDPLRTTTAYSNNLYSLEFFELASRHLGSCGIFLLWTDDPLVVPRTAATVFPHVSLYPLTGSEGFLLGSKCPLSRNQRRLERLVEGTPVSIRSLVGRWIRGLQPMVDRDALLRATSGLRINRDWKPVSEYYLGPGREDHRRRDRSRAPE